MFFFMFCSFSVYGDSTDSEDSADSEVSVDPREYGDFLNSANYVDSSDS